MCALEWAHYGDNFMSSSCITENVRLKKAIGEYNDESYCQIWDFN